MTIHLRSHAPLTWLALMAGCFAIVMLAVVAVRGSSIAGAAAPRDLLRVAGYEVPADLDDGHFSLNVASGSPAISEDEALSIASQYAGGLATGATSVSIQYALFTDNNRGTEGPDGALVRDFVDVPSMPASLRRERRRTLCARTERCDRRATWRLLGDVQFPIEGRLPVDS